MGFISYLIFIIFAIVFIMLIIEAAIAKLGEENQMRQTQEELAELIVAINKYERFIKNNRHPKLIKLARRNIIEEMTDVLIMIDAVKNMLDIQDEEIKKVRDFKLNRLLNRLKEGCDL